MNSLTKHNLWEIGRFAVNAFVGFSLTAPLVYFVTFLIGSVLVYPGVALWGILTNGRHSVQVDSSLTWFMPLLFVLCMNCAYYIFQHLRRQGFVIIPIWAFFSSVVFVISHYINWFVIRPHVEYHQNHLQQYTAVSGQFLGTILGAVIAEMFVSGGYLLLMSFRPHKFESIYQPGFFLITVVATVLGLWISSLLFGSGFMFLPD